MGYEFSLRMNLNDLATANLLAIGADLLPEDVQQLVRYRRYWNFFEGFHWEEIEESDKPEITQNYCRAFINKFVAFELGTGFSIKMEPAVETVALEFLNNVWEDNNKLQLCNEFGQMKAVCGDAWIQVLFESKFIKDNAGNESPNPDFDDPYDEYDKGRIRLLSVPTNIVFPRYKGGIDKEQLVELIIMYPMPKDPLHPNNGYYLYRQIWTKEKVDIYKGKELVETIPNKYKIIPFFHIKNFPLAGRTYGLSDLEDLIPLNTELNLKKSDLSEILDYYGAPVTVIYGARATQLEKGANKVWGGLPKDAKVENLELKGDLKAGVDYAGDIKTAMHEIGGVPESSLGKEMNISNTSGVALQVTLMPLIERVRVKRSFTSEAISQINKFILKIGVEEGLITKPDTLTDDTGKEIKITNKDFYQNEVIFEDNLPKDRLVEIQEIQLEMKLGLCDREEAMKRLGKADIQTRIGEIDVDMKKTPYIYGLIKDDKGNLSLPVKANGASGGTGNVMTRPVGTNKAGNLSQVNAGLQNSPVKQVNTNS